MVVHPEALTPAAAAVRSSAIRDLLEVAEKPGVISLAGGLPAPEAFPVDAIRRAAERVLDDDPAGALQYSTTEGHAGLRQWIAARRSATPDRVIVTHGSQQALDLVVRATVAPGAVVAVADPAYVGALGVFRLARARVIGIPTENGAMNVDALAARLRRGLRPRLVYVVANFHNPTGGSLDADQRVALAALGERYGFLIVDDDPSGDLRWAGRPAPPLAALTDRVVTLGSFSKILSPGLRLGYAVAPESLTRTLALIKQSADLHTSSLAQRVAAAVLGEAGFLECHLSRITPLYANRAAALESALRDAFGDAVDLRTPEGGMFVWARFLRSGIDTETLLPAAVERGVAYVPGSAFAVRGGHRDAVRLSFATATPHDLAVGVRRLARAMGLVRS